MKENTYNYSDFWQPYIGYDKFEYDIKLDDGTIIKNCYPNAGKFNSGKTCTEESFVKEIRFSNRPILYLNYNVSKIPQKDSLNYELKQGVYMITLNENDLPVEKEDKEKYFISKQNLLIETLNYLKVDTNDINIVFVFKENKQLEGYTVTNQPVPYVNYYSENRIEDLRYVDVSLKTHNRSKSYLNGRRGETICEDGIHKSTKIQRNASCPCNSGLKYKKCCGK